MSKTFLLLCTGFPSNRMDWNISLSRDKFKTPFEDIETMQPAEVSLFTDRPMNFPESGNGVLGEGIWVFSRSSSSLTPSNEALDEDWTDEFGQR